MFSDVRAWLEPWYNKWAAMVLGAAVGLGGYEWICWSKLSASDWGTWVGAIGTVATLIGTIVLATNERRERLRSERNLALVTVAALTFQIPFVQSSLRSVIITMQRDVDQNQATDYASVADTLNTMPLWTREELATLVGIRDHLAARLAFAGAEIAAIQRAMDKAAELKFHEAGGLSAIFAAHTIPQIESPLDVLEDAFRRCREFMDETGFSSEAPSGDPDQEAS